MYILFICLVTNLLRTFIILRFMSVFFDKKQMEKKREVCTFALFYIMTVSLCLVFHHSIINVFSNIIGMVIITFLYSDTLKKKIVVVMLICFINIFCDYIVILSFTNQTVEKEQSELIEVIALFLLLISELIIEILVDIKKRFILIPVQLLLLILIPITSIILLYTFMVEKFSHRSVLVLFSLGFLTINMTVFYLSSAIVDTYSHKLEKDLLEQKANANANQLDIIMQSQKNIRSLQHDMKHHIWELKTMAVKVNSVEMVKYLDKMKSFMDNPEEYVYSGNTEIDSVLNLMILNAKKVLTKVNVKMCVPDDLTYHSFELNVILGNLLENAIEAAKQTEDKILNVNLELDRGILFIHIKNSYSGKIEKHNQKFITSKKDKSKHGIGLQNIKRVVEMHNGTMTIHEKENMFEVDIMLYLSNVK